MNQSHYMVDLWSTISSAQLNLYAPSKADGVEDGK